MPPPGGHARREALDGGYGWAVAFGCMLVHAVVGGCGSGISILYIRQLEIYRGSDSATSAALSVFLMLGLMLSPISTILMNRFSARVVVIAGGLIMGTAWAVSGFAPSLVVLAITFGALGGIGMSLIYAPSLVMVSLYFEKRRAIATGLATSGTAFGAFLFPPIITYVLEEYGYTGTLLIMGGILFNLCVAGALYRPLEKSLKLKRLREERQRRQATPLTHVETGKGERKSLLIEGENLQENAASEHALAERQHPGRPSSKDDEEDHSLMRSESQDNREKNAQSKEGDGNESPQGRKQLKSTSSANCDINVKENIDDGEDADGSKGCVPSALSAPESAASGTSYEMRDKDNISEKLTPEHASQSDMLSDVSETMLPETCRKRSNSGRELNEDTGQSGGKGPKKAKGTCCRCCPAPLREFGRDVRKLLDFTVFKDFTWCLFMLSTGLFTMMYISSVTYLVALSKQYGLDKTQRAFILSAWGIADLPSRLFIGLLFDLPKMRAYRRHVFTTAKFFCSLCTLCLPLTTTFTEMMVNVVVLSLARGIIRSQTAVIYGDLIGVERMAKSYGLLIMCHGVMTFTGPPIFGAMKDATGDYRPAFYAMGAVGILGALILHTEFLITRYRRNRHQTTDAQPVVL